LEWSQWSKVDIQFKIWLSGVCTGHIHLKFIGLTTSTHQSPALEANSSTDFRNLKLLYYMHKSPPPAPVLNKTSPIYALPSCLLQNLLVLSSHLYLVIPRGLFFKFPQQNTVCISLLLLTSHMPSSSHHPWFHHPIILIKTKTFTEKTQVLSKVRKKAVFKKFQENSVMFYLITTWQDMIIT
jgi:hypothetical protein